MIVSIKQMSYSVEYVPNGGTISPTPSTGPWKYSSGGTLPTGDVATRESYTLTGWKVSSTDETLNPGTSFTGSTLGVTTNNQTVTLTAQWKANGYKATIAAGEGGTGGCTVSYDYSTSQQSKAITLPTREGHAIEKWTATEYSGSAPTIEGDSLKIPAGTTGNFTMTPTWKAVSCVITTGVTPSGSGTVSGGGTYDYGKPVTLTASAGKGYAFVQWQDGNTDNPRTITATESATYTATFKASSYKATIAAGEGGTGGCTTNYAYSTSAQTMTITLPTRTGHTISDWEAVGQTGSAPTIKGTTLTIPANTYGNFTMTPTWKAVSCVITTVVTPAGSGTVSGGGTYDYGKSVTLTASAGKGYAFVQWQDGNTDNPRTITATESATYTATFQTQGYTATIAAGEKGSGGCQIGYDYSESLQTKTIQSMPTRRGHSISGWTATGYSGSTPTISDTTLTIPAKTSGDFTMTPKWTPNTITVKYNGNGKTSGSTSKQDFTYDVEDDLRENGFKKSYTVTYYANGGTVSPSTATADYKFQNWNDQADGTGEYSYDDGEFVTNPCDSEGGTVTLYAQWNKSVFVWLPTPTWAGHTFNGWYTAQTGGYCVGKGGEQYVPTESIALFAHWDVNTCTVTFNPMGGTCGEASRIVECGSYIGALPIPTHDTRQFMGWYNDPTGGNQITQDTVVTRDMTAYAHWGEAQKYTISVVANPEKGGTVSGGGKYGYGESVTLTATANAGYSFTQWNDGETSASREITVTGNATYTANFAAEEYYVAFDGNEATSGTMNVQTVKVGVETALSKNAFAKTGASFAGWSSAKGGAVVYHDQQKVTDIAARGQTNTLYAVWTPWKNYVKFDGNGKTGGEMAVQEFEYGVAQALSANEFAKTGYTFAGWTNETKHVGYADKQTVTFTESNNKTNTLKAVWAANSYTVMFDANGGEGSMDPLDCRYDKESTLPANEFTKTGCNFMGWATNLTSGVVFADGAKVKNLTAQAEGVVTLYAQWSYSLCYVDFKANGGEGEMAQQTFTNGIAQALAANQFKKENYALQGWTNELTKTFYADKQVVTFNEPDNTTNTLKAVWTINTYTMHFAPNATTVLNPKAQPDKTGCESGAEIELPPCQYVNLPSCGFLGWVDKNSVTNQPGTNVTHTVSKSGEKVTYKAAWQDNSDLSKAVGLDTVTALTNTATEVTTYRWEVSKEGARTTGGTCVRHAFPSSQGKMQESKMSMLVKGPGTLTFWYKKNKDVVANDYLALEIDGTKIKPYLSRSAKTTYQACTNKIEDVNVPLHTITWSCWSDGSTTAGRAFYIDDVTWTPEGGKPKPLIFFIR